MDRSDEPSDEPSDERPLGVDGRRERSDEHSDDDDEAVVQNRAPRVIDSSDDDEGLVPFNDKMWKTQGGPTANERLRMDKMYDPRTDPRHGKTILGKMTEQARAEKDLLQQKSEEDKEAEALKQEQLRAELTEIRRSCQDDDPEGGCYCEGTEQQFAGLLMAQHRSGVTALCAVWRRADWQCDRRRRDCSALSSCGQRTLGVDGTAFGASCSKVQGEQVLGGA